MTSKNGLNLLIVASVEFRLAIEKKVPDKKDNGITIKFVTAAKLSNLSAHNPAINPMHAKSKDPSNAKIKI